METLHPESRNLAPKLNKKKLEQCAGDLWTYIKADDDSRSEWKEKHNEWHKLYYQIDRAKNPPWQGSSEESIPMLAEACNQFHARAYQNMFPNPRIIKALPTGKVDAQSKERAERVSTHLSWQLMVQDRKYKRRKDRLLLALPLDGCFFTKTYWNPQKKRKFTDNVRAMDLIVPYGTGPRELEDIDRKTQVLFLSMNRCKALKENEYFSDVPDVWLDEGTEDEVENEAQGTQNAGYNGLDVAKIYECHTLWDFDNDGIAEPYIITLDAQSQKILRVSIRYDTNEAGHPTNDKEPVEYFTPYHFLENPHGFYGLGMGHLIGQLNMAVNKLLRQTVDAGTLANAGNHSGFVSQQLGGLKGGDITMRLGKFMKLPGSTDDIQKGIFQFKFPGATPTLMDAIALLMQKSDRIATVTEALTGQTEKVMQPTTVMALIEQGLQQFSTVYERVLESWKDELALHYRLNYKYMDPQEYFSVLDITGDFKQFAASREDYAPDMHVMPVADPKNTSEQRKLAKAQAEYGVLSQNPMVMNSPIHFYNVTRRFLQAIGVEAIDEVLPNPAKDMLPRVDDPQAENAFILGPEPMISAAYPDQDHLFHMQVHMGLLRDPVYGPSLSDLGFQKLMEHIAAHRMMLYGSTERGQGPASELAPIGDNGMGAQGAGGAVSPQLGGNGGFPVAPAASWAARSPFGTAGNS